MNPYNILGIPSGTEIKDVRKKYLTLIKTHHPDHGGNVTDFLKITEAYRNILSENDGNNGDITSLESVLSRFSDKFRNSTKRQKQSSNDMNGKTRIAPENESKTIRLHVPVEALLTNPTISKTIGSTHDGKPIIVNFNSGMRYLETTVDSRNTKQTMKVKIIPKIENPFSIIGDHNLLLKQIVNDNQYAKDGQITLPYPNGSVVVCLEYPPSREPLQIFKGLGLPKSMSEKGDMYVQFRLKSRRVQLSREFSTAGIPIGMPVFIDEIIK